MLHYIIPAIIAALSAIGSLVYKIIKKRREANEARRKEEERLDKILEPYKENPDMESIIHVAKHMQETDKPRSYSETWDTLKKAQRRPPPKNPKTEEDIAREEMIKDAFKGYNSDGPHDLHKASRHVRHRRRHK